MQWHRLVYNAYKTARFAVRAAGISKPLRRSLGPMAARFVLRTSANQHRPVEVQGHQMFLAPPGGYPSPDMLADRYEVSTTRLFKQLATPGMVVVDIGAHAGFFTLIAARNVGAEGKVFAFEPEPRNYELLAKNIALNSYDNVVAEQKAVTDANGTLELFLSVLDSGSHSIYSSAARGVADSLTVDATTIDTYLETHGSPRVGLVKLDVEGAEISALEGMQNLFQTTPGLNLIVEFCPFLIQSTGSEPMTLIDKLVSLDLQVHVIDDGKGPVDLAEVDVTRLVSRLLHQEGYVNLFCVKK